MQFKFHSHYADVEIEDAEVFLAFFHHAEMRHRQIDTDARVLVSTHYIMQEFNNQHTIYQICESALDEGIHYLTVEYTGEVDITDTLVLFGAIR